MSEKMVEQNGKWHIKKTLHKLKKDGSLLALEIDKAKSNKRVVLTAVEQCGVALEHASEKLKDDKEVVLMAIRQNPKAFAFVSDSLKTDIDISLAYEIGLVAKSHEALNRVTLKKQERAVR